MQSRAGAAWPPSRTHPCDPRPAGRHDRADQHNRAERNHALFAADSQIVVTPVCNARTLADGWPPMGIACAQQEFSRVYPLADDPERCVEEFLELAAEHAHELAERLAHQEASVQRFIELSDG